MERIQFVGACNPPTDPGRNILSKRFLNMCPLILVDFPGRDSLHQIYGTFTRGLLKLVNKLSEWWEPLTEVTQSRFFEIHTCYGSRIAGRTIKFVEGLKFVFLDFL